MQSFLLQYNVFCPVAAFTQLLNLLYPTRTKRYNDVTDETVESIPLFYVFSRTICRFRVKPV